MNILALEASNNCALVAAKAETQLEVVALLRLYESRALARELAIYVSRIMQTAGWNWQNTGGLAIGLGPGSWTSLRIALSTWKTLALAREIPLVGVPTFDAIALAACKKIAHDASTQEFLLAVTGRCRPGEIYCKLFLCGKNIEALSAEETIAPAELAHRVVEISASRSLPLLIAADDGGALSAELQKSNINWQNIEVPLEDVVVAIAQIGAEKLKRESSSAMELLPLYVAASSAERVAAERAARQNAAPQNA